MKLNAILFLCLVFLPTNIYAANQPDNYCDDPASWQKWQQLLDKYPTDDSIASIYAFRVGLCSMVKSGQIETARATKLFEQMRDVIIKGIEEDKQRRGKKSGI